MFCRRFTIDCSCRLFTINDSFEGIRTCSVDYVLLIIHVDYLQLDMFLFLRAFFFLGLEHDLYVLRLGIFIKGFIKRYTSSRNETGC